MKAEWPEEIKAARRLAGHANSSRGQSVLWIVGLDEKKGLIGVKKEELSKWYAKVRSEFDGVYPELTDLVVPIDGGKYVQALLFDTSRSPYVVKNPDGGKIGFEVPWREATGVRTATRSDLLRVLTPVTALPNFEILSGNLTAKPGLDPGITDLRLAVTLYVIPNSSPTTIPLHKTAVEVAIPKVMDTTELALEALLPRRRIRPETGRQIGCYPEMETASKTIDYTHTELLIYGPGQFVLSASLGLKIKLTNVNQPAQVSIKFGIAESERVIQLALDLIPQPSEENQLARWIV